MVQQQQKGLNRPLYTSDARGWARMGSPGLAGFVVQQHELSMRMIAYAGMPSCAATMQLAVAHAVCVEFAVRLRAGPPRTASDVRAWRGWLLASSEHADSTHIHIGHCMYGAAPLQLLCTGSPGGGRVVV
jgi:hypothetical protein